MELTDLVAVRGAEAHPHALRRLRRDLPAVTWVDVEREPLPSQTPIIEVTTEEALPEGAFELRVSGGRIASTITVQGGPVSGVVYGIGELVERIKNGEWGAGTVTSAPRLAHRTMWTWDHSTNWDLEQVGQQEIGAMNPYSKPTDGFLQDYCRLVDFASNNRIPAITVYGLLRDSHGGVGSAQELCRYAAERGVRIVAGVGINAYGGIYWEGEHPYNLATWLRTNPELAAQFQRDVGFDISEVGPLSFPVTEYAMAACPSRPENAAFHRDGIAWLTETLDIGGINFETGDYGVCECKTCQRRRSADGSWSIADMAQLYPQLFATARERSSRPLWLYCEMYWDNIFDLQAQEALQTLPDDAIYQYCINRSYWPRVRTECDINHVAALPHSTNVLRTHMGTQWNQERYKYVGHDFAAMNDLAAAVGMSGTTIFGEVSDYSVPNELNYLAFARSGYDRDFHWETFQRREVDLRLGGTDAAERFWELLAHVENSTTGADIEVYRAEASATSQGLPSEVARRWLWLAERASRRAFALRVDAAA